jgi:hypothetical protein
MSEVTRVTFVLMQVWHFRRRVLTELKTPIELELDYCDQVVEESPKNYQLW